MDDDPLSRQQAMDAAAAVAVAAAAAAAKHANDGEDNYEEHQPQHGSSHSIPEHVSTQRIISHGEDSRHPHTNVEHVPSMDVTIEHQAEDLMHNPQDMSHFTHDAGDIQTDSSGMQGSEHAPPTYDGSLYETEPDSHDMASTSRIPHQPPPRPLTHHTKRRKINTCLPCKRRKVKCDRQKPHCGQCKKSQISSEECTWSTAIDHASSQSAVDAPAFSTPISTSVEAPPPTSNGNNWYDIGNSSWTGANAFASVDQDTQTLLGRVTALEAALAAATQNRVDAQDTASHHRPLNGSSWNDEKASTTPTQEPSEAERGVAADALAMIGHQRPSPSSPSELQEGRIARLKYRRLDNMEAARLTSDSWLFYDFPSSFKLQNLIRLLPEMRVFRSMLHLLDTIQEHGMHFGISVQLIEHQLETFLQQVHKDHESPSIVDVSFLALIFACLALGGELCSEELFATLEIANSDEEIRNVIDIWTQCARVSLALVLSRDQTNLNVISCLSLQAQLLSSRGNTCAASVALASALRHARALGLDSIPSQEDDLSSWDKNISPRPRGNRIFAFLDHNQFLFPVILGTEHSTVRLLEVYRPLTRSPLIREAGRTLLCHILEQSWLEDPLSSNDIQYSSNLPLPLPFQPQHLHGSYQLRSGEGEGSELSESSGILLLSSLSTLGSVYRSWNTSMNDKSSLADIVNSVQQLSPPLINANIDLQNNDDSKSQHIHTLYELFLNYVVFSIRRQDESQGEKCVEAACLVIQNRLALVRFPTSPHKHFAIQRFALECALFLVVYVHQYGSQLPDERRQDLQNAIDELYAQPGYEHASALLSLSVQDEGQDDVEQSQNQDKQLTHPDSSLETAELEPTQSVALTGMATPKGKLSLDHPIVVGLSGFLTGHTSPFGTSSDTESFWTALSREASLFLSTA